MPSQSSSTVFIAFFKTCRPHQWIKNLFVAAPLLFSRRIDDGHAILQTLLGFGCFCMLSSTVYILNDLVDVEKDRNHPTKKKRPIAAGQFNPEFAKIITVLLGFSALLLGSFLGRAFLITASGYLALNIAYSFQLKRLPFIDVASISLGFLLRVLAGAFAIPVHPSGWLLLCTLLLAGLLGFGKRAHELRVAQGSGEAQRSVLSSYSHNVLKYLLAGLALATTVTYALYTQSEHAQTFFGTRALVFTLPFVIFGILRFLWLTTKKGDAESPTDSMIKDKLFLVNLVLYALIVFAII